MLRGCGREDLGSETQLHSPSALGREVLGLLPVLVQPPSLGHLDASHTLREASPATRRASLGL